MLDRKVEPDAVHQGMILEAKPLRQPQLDEIEQSGVVVMLDQVTDPHNVGAILRTCAAFQVTRAGHHGAPFGRRPPAYFSKLHQGLTSMFRLSK